MLLKLNNMLEASIDFSKNIKLLSGELKGSGETIRNEVESVVKTSINEMKTSSENMVNKINSMVENSISSMQNKNNESLENFEEINRKTLSNFGSHLANISGKLAEDFEKVQNALSLKKDN